jgi:hypothetical protein
LGESDLIKRHGPRNKKVELSEKISARHMKKLLLLLALLATPAIAQQAVLLNVTSTLNGSPAIVGGQKWHVETASKPWSIAQINATTLRFELRSGDVRPGEYSSGVERDEINAGQEIRFKPGAPYTVQFDLNVLPGSQNTAQWLVLYQLAYPFQGMGVWNGSPDVEFDLAGERLTLVAHDGCGDTAQQINWPNGLWTDLQPVQRGTTHTFRFTMLFDADSTHATVQAWRDGIQIVNFSGAIGCASTREHFQSFGIYRAHAPQTIATQFGNLSFGTGPN